MLKRVNLWAGTVLCGMALAVLAPSAHAAGEPKVLVRAQALNPFSLVWMDTQNGTGLDGDTAKTVQAEYDKSVWEIRDDGTIVVSKDGKVLATAAWASNKEGTYVPLHGRSGPTTIDGTVYRNSGDMTKGYGELHINQLSKDGKASRCLRVEVNLDFGGAAPTNPPVDDPSGFD